MLFFEEQKNLPVKICGLCFEEDISPILKIAKKNDYNNLILGLLTNLKHFAQDGLSLDNMKLTNMISFIRKVSMELNIEVKIACVNHYLYAQELLDDIKNIYSKLPDNITQGFDLIQIHDNMSPDEIKKFIDEQQKQSKFMLPKIVKAVHMPHSEKAYKYEEILENALIYAKLDYIDAILLDSANLATNQIGGTGLVSNWDVAAQLIDDVHRYTNKYVGLAGGLKPSNFQEAINKTKPDFIDANTGFRNANDMHKNLEAVEIALNIAKNIK